MNLPRRSRAHYLVSIGALVLTRGVMTVGGFAVVVLLASMFGATADTDAYFIARLIPITLVSPLAIAYNLAFIPVYTSARTARGEVPAGRLAGDFLKVALAASVLLSVLYAVSAGWIVRALAPGFSESAHLSAVWMTRVMAVAFVLLSLHSVFDSLLNADHRFVISALSSLWIPAGALFGVLVLTRWWGIKGVAVGVVIGFALQAATLVPMMRRYVTGGGWGIDWGNRGFRRALADLGVTMLAIAVAQLNIAVDRLFASLLGEGAVSALSLGVTFVGLVPFLIALPIFKVMYPVMVELVEHRRNDELRKFFSENILIIAFVALPLALAVAMFSGTISDLVFHYGRFSETAAMQTAEVIFYQALGLPAAVVTLLTMYYFVLTRRWKWIFPLLFVTLVLNAVLDWIMARLIGVGGIALTGTVVAVIRVWASILIAGYLLQGPILSRLALPLAKVAVAAALAGGAMFGGARLLGSLIETGRPAGQLSVLVVGVLLGSLVHLAANHVLRNDELWNLLLGIRPTRVVT